MRIDRRKMDSVQLRLFINGEIIVITLQCYQNIPCLVTGAVVSPAEVQSVVGPHRRRQHILPLYLIPLQFLLKQ